MLFKKTYKLDFGLCEIVLTGAQEKAFLVFVLCLHENYRGMHNGS